LEGLCRFVEAHFAALLAASSGTVQRLEAACKEHALASQQPKPEDFDAFWSSVAAQTFQELTDAVDRVVTDLQPLALPQTAAGTGRTLASQATRICHKVHVKLQQYFLNLENVFLSSIAINDSPNDKGAPVPFGPFLLVLCGVSRRMGARIERYAAKIARTFPTDSDVPLMQTEDLKKRFEALSVALLDSYVALEGGQLSSYMHKYITAANWLRSKEPRDVGLGASLFVERVREIDRYVAPFFDDSLTGSASGSGSAPGSSGGASSSSATIPTGAAAGPRLSGTSPMFERRPDAFGHVEFARKAVLASATRIGLKAMFECVRLQTFGRSGFQQLQVDKFYLQAMLFSIMGPVRDINSLLDDIEANAQQRCIDPVPMDPTVTQHILRHHQLSLPDNSPSLSPTL